MKLSLVYSKSRDFGATRGRHNTGKDIELIEQWSSMSFLSTKTNYIAMVHSFILDQKAILEASDFILHLTASYQMQSNLRMRSRKLFIIVSAQPLLINHCTTMYYHLIL